ncbi:ester cyclase [uncultured Amnibacterium sp.]|uniref:ester cyclase n=1 Tax=uncultured Amnibacterium sp. TaxID=1631851 RepID=UPI0035CBF256
MAIEVTEGGQATLDLMGTLGDQSLPLDRKFVPGFVDHDPAPGQPEDGSGLAWYWGRFAESFSDIEREVVETIATPEHLITVMNLTATHTGDFLGHAATGKRFTVRNVQVAKFVDGRMSERWGSTDQLGILQQLGLV